MRPCDPSDLPSRAGAYVLEFSLELPTRLKVGRLGELTVGPGRLRYYGSAWGPGGLRARVRRHLEPEDRAHRWHIDALTKVAAVDRVLIEVGGRECELVNHDLASGDWQTAAQGFGSSDCTSCPAHLLVCRVGG